MEMQWAAREPPTRARNWATLLVGENFIKVRVTAPDEQADYTIRVTRQARVLGSDATLSADLYDLFPLGSLLTQCSTKMSRRTPPPWRTVF